jgi:hypothetical protein
MCLRRLRICHRRSTRDRQRFLAEVREKGWELELRAEERRVIPYLVGTFGMAAVGIAALVALLLWLVLKAL